ncbi:MAG: ParA family protein [Pseudohongiella sp.]|nr:ParA family protein [Pseudohongiella sp.]
MANLSAITTQIKERTKEQAIVMATTQSKGGVGKTVYSFCSGVFAAEKLNLRVLLIDLDQNGNLTSLCMDKDEALQIDNVATVYRANKQSEDFANISPKLIDYQAQFGVSLTGGSLSLLPAASDLTFVDNSGDISVFQQLNAWLKTQRGKYDIVVMDNPGHLGNLTICSLVASDYILCPLEMGEFGFQGIAIIQRFLNEVNENFRSQNPVKSLGYLPYKVDSRTKEFKRLMGLISEGNAEHLLVNNGNAYIEHRASVAAAVNASAAPWNYNQTDGGARAAGNNYIEVLTHIYSNVAGI